MPRHFRFPVETGSRVGGRSPTAIRLMFKVMTPCPGTRQGLRGIVATRTESRGGRGLGESRRLIWSGSANFVRVRATWPRRPGEVDGTGRVGVGFGQGPRRRIAHVSR